MREPDCRDRRGETFTPTSFFVSVQFGAFPYLNVNQRLRPAGEQLAGSGVLYLFTYITFFINILNGNNDGQEKLLNDYDLCRGVRAAPLRPKGRGGGAWHLAIL